MSNKCSVSYVIFEELSSSVIFLAFMFYALAVIYMNRTGYRSLFPQGNFPFHSFNDFLSRTDCNVTNIPIVHSRPRIQLGVERLLS
jgi:hypothetical protein